MTDDSVLVSLVEKHPLNLYSDSQLGCLSVRLQNSLPVQEYSACFHRQPLLSRHFEAGRYTRNKMI